MIERIRGRLADAGFGLCAPLSVEEYDRLVPAPWRAQAVFAETRGIMVVANAGHSLWPRFRASAEAALEDDPLDRYTARALADACAPGAHFALYHERRAGAYLPLVALAERAGLGAPGRVGVLLHPEYGPWLSLRGLVYLPVAVPWSEPAQ